MAKNRNHYFKVKPGDDARLFADIDIETEGFIARLRRTAHDREPYGFLVDAQHRPYDAKRIADVVHLTNQRTAIVLAEAITARLIDTVARFRADLAAAAGKNKRGKVRLEAFDVMCLELAGDVVPGNVMLMPTLVDDYIDTETGKRFGKDGGNPELVKFPRKADPLTPPHNEEDNESSLTGWDKSQKSEVRSHSQSTESSSSGERESSTARAIGGSNERPMPWSVYTARAHEIAVWQKHRGPSSEDGFAADFEAEFEFTWSQWCEIKRLMESAIPAPCRDGHHVFEGAGSQCLYCPFTRVGETA